MRGVARTREYVHQELNQEVTAVGGHYLLLKEVRLPFRGRQVLYLVGVAAFDSTCCGPGGCGYAVVPGFIVRWKARQNLDGLALSEVEPIQDHAAQEELRRLIIRREWVQQVRFE